MNGAFVMEKADRKAALKTDAKTAVSEKIACILSKFAL